MSKIFELTAEDQDLLCSVGKALSSKERIKILKLLYYNSYNIGEIAVYCDIPASSAAFHVKILEEAKLINTENQPGNRGLAKLCSRRHDFLNIRLTGLPQNVDEVKSISMPVGLFTNCRVSVPCGISDENEIIGSEDNPANFFLPKRTDAKLLWTSSGFVEYTFPYDLPRGAELKRLSLSLEICSEAPNYREDWKSDITIWINGVECATWQSPGDFGNRRGLLNPEWWDSGVTQYGKLLLLEVTHQQTDLNSQKASCIALKDLKLDDSATVIVRIGNKETAEYIGGFNIFGSKFGDYQQDIMLSLCFSRSPD